VVVHGSGYGTTKVTSTALSHAPQTVRLMEQRRDALDRRGRGYKRWVASRSCHRRPWVFRCLPVDTIGGKPLEEDFVSPLAGEEQMTRGVAVLAKAVLDEHSL
jgi:hypothetical protein